MNLVPRFLDQEESEVTHNFSNWNGWVKIIIVAVLSCCFNLAGFEGEGSLRQTQDEIALKYTVCSMFFCHHVSGRIPTQHARVVAGVSLSSGCQECGNPIYIHIYIYIYILDHEHDEVAWNLLEASNDIQRQLNWHHYGEKCMKLDLYDSSNFMKGKMSVLVVPYSFRWFWMVRSLAAIQNCRGWLTCLYILFAL